MPSLLGHRPHAIDEYAGSGEAWTINGFLHARATSEQIKQRHAEGDAIRHLIEDQRVGALGNFGGDLDTTIDRARVHDEAVGLEAGRASCQPAGSKARTGGLR